MSADRRDNRVTLSRQQVLLLTLANLSRILQKMLRKEKLCNGEI